MITIHMEDPQTRWRAGFAEIIRDAITTTRPENERWSVRMAAPIDGITRVHFSRDAEPAQSLALTLADDLSSYRVLYSTTCRFLRRGWPGALPQRS